jgi:hypothetical protein
MIGIISKDFLPKKNNSFVWFNAIFLIYLVIIGKVDSLTIITAYFLETIIIGIVYVFKMYSIISFDNNKFGNSSKSNYFMILFFIFHYGFFIAIQLVFVFVFLGLSDNNIKEAFYILENLKYVLSYSGMTLVLISITVYNFADYVINFILPKKYETSDLNKIFSEPYIRIFIQQFTVILGGFFIIFSTRLMIVASLLIVFRTLIELYFIANPTANILTDNPQNPFGNDQNKK